MNRSLPATSAVPNTTREPKFNSQLFIDVLTWLVAVPVAGLLRYDFVASQVAWIPLISLAIVMAAGQLAVGFLLSLYSGRFTYGSFEEVRSVTVVATALSTVAALVILAAGPALHIPRSIVLISFPIAMVSMLGTRYIKRLFIERGKLPTNASPTLVYGAGYLGESIVRRMLTDPRSPYLPIGFIDDNAARSNRRVRSVEVLGTIDDFGEIVENTGAKILVVAISQADTRLLWRVDRATRRHGVDVKVMPPLDAMLTKGRSGLDDLRSIEIVDLLSRTPVDTEVELIAGYLTGKRVLVTGAGGSIGSELCRQIARFGPRKLIMLDRDETGIQETQISISGNGLLHSDDVVLADIRSADRLVTIFEDHRPDVVFHAAALKHLPLLEQYPDEAWDTNVIGTLNVLRAAQNTGVETFVNVSTDKAANPTSVLGHSKRVAEKLTAWMAEEEKSRARYVSVRFGNVIGSRGSMLPTFTRLIEQGGPLTVTHPEVTRYFMTIPEACQLVMQAGGIGRSGEVLILDMGEPVKILDIAERMVQLSGKDIEIVFTGLREGEKLHEVLIGDSEHDERPFHDLITHAYVGLIAPEDLDKKGWEARLHNGQAEVSAEANA